MTLNPFSLKGSVILCCFLINHSFAQLSGTVTVNSAMSTGAGNYQSFTALAAALNSVGVSGPLIVNVAPGSGPYIEQPVFQEAQGVSAANNITINGNNTLLTYTNQGSQSWTLLLKGADYMYFNDLNMKAIGTSFQAVACHLCEGANYNRFSRCTFSCVPNNTTFQELPLAISSSSNSANAPSTDKAGSYNTFDGCTMFSGSYAVYLSGDPNAPAAKSNIPNNHGNSFTNCQMVDWQYYGVYAEYQENLSISDCHIDRPTRPQFAVGYGIGVYRDRGGLSCLRNCIENLAGGFPNTLPSAHINGIHYDGTNNSPGSPAGLIKSNVISNIVTNGAAYGIELTKFNGACQSNTVELNNGTGYSGNCYAFYGTPSNTSPDSMLVLNNYFSITHNGSGQKYCAYLSSTNRSRINYNKYYLASGLAGTNAFGYFNAPFNAFSQWKAQGFEAQGMSYNSDPNSGKPISCSTTTSSVETGLSSSAPAMHISFKLFPNPASGEFFVEFDDQEEKKLELMDVTGRSILTQRSDSDRIRFNTQHLPAGIYFLRVSKGKASGLAKIIVQ